MHDLTRALAILGATGAGVTLVTLLLIGAIVPQAMVEPTSSPVPSFDLAVPPDRAGGSLTVTGDRTGTLQIDRAQGGVQHVTGDDDSVIVQRGQFRLIGDDGQIIFGGDPDDGVTQIDFDGLSVYLDPGDCTVTPGARNSASGLIVVLIECPQLAAIRDGGTISVEGVLAIPGDVVGERGDLPQNDGTVDVGEETVALRELIMVGGGELVGTGRVPLSVHGADLDSLLALEYDPESAEMFLTFMEADGVPVSIPGECPVIAEKLGDLTEFTTVLRLTIDCDNAVLDDGTLVTLDGTVVVDSDVKLSALDR
jgi:hypothetical protein